MNLSKKSGTKVKNNFGQSTMEYLIIVAIVAVISLAVVGISTGMISVNLGQASENAGQLGNLMSSGIAIKDAVGDSNGVIILVLQNIQPDSTKLKRIFIDNIETFFDSGLYYGSQKAFKFNTIKDSCKCSANASNVNCEMAFHFESNYGISKKSTTTVSIDCQEGILSDQQNTVNGKTNLVSNGTGFMENNYNFSAASYENGTKSFSRPCFLVSVGGYVAMLTTEFIEINTDKNYGLSGYFMSGNSDGSDYNSSNSNYGGYAPFDADKLLIIPNNYQKYAGSTDSSLAQQLNPGDTTVVLSNSAGWSNAAGGYTRNFLWWPYTTASGITYTDYTYSRNYSGNYLDFLSNGAWAVGGISGNTITLRAPWAGPVLPIGTQVRNSTSGGTYQYCMGNFAVPNSWLYKQCFVKGVITDGLGNYNKFPPGTKYVKMIILANYNGSNGNHLKWGEVMFWETYN